MAVSGEGRGEEKALFAPFSHLKKKQVDIALVSSQRLLPQEAAKGEAAQRARIPVTGKCFTKRILCCSRKDRASAFTQKPLL